MKIPTSAFTTFDWTTLEPEEHAGEHGLATWRTMNLGDIRIRMVEYSPGYVADHWCDRGHILYVTEGELETELTDGRVVRLPAGAGYHVSDRGDAAHRSRTTTGAKLFVVD
jgi:hypothetical protein